MPAVQQLLPSPTSFHGHNYDFRIYINARACLSLILATFYIMTSKNVIINLVYACVIHSLMLFRTHIAAFLNDTS